MTLVASRITALLLAVVALCPVACSQVLRRRNIAICDLTALSGVFDPHGRAASAALGEALSRTSGFEIVPPSEVDEAMGVLGGFSGADRIGGLLHAERVLQGNVLVQTTWRNGARWARASLSVLLFTGDTGLYIGGGRATGTARAEGAWSDQELVREALRRAAEDAVSRLFASPRTASIIEVPSGRWTIDKGFADGFRAGARIDVMQGDVVRARARVGLSKAHRADLYLAETYGSVAPGNRAVCEFMPSELPKDRHAKEWIDPRSQVR